MPDTITDAQILDWFEANPGSLLAHSMGDGRHEFAYHRGFKEREEGAYPERTYSAWHPTIREAIRAAITEGAPPPPIPLDGYTLTFK